MDKWNNGIPMKGAWDDREKFLVILRELQLDIPDEQVFSLAMDLRKRYALKALSTSC